MEKTPAYLPELIFTSSGKKEASAILRMLKKGFIKKIAPRIYTSNFEESPESLISRNILAILGQLYPGAMLSHRSAIEYKPTALGHIIVTYSYTKKISLPGITIRFIEGPEPLPGDTKLNGELHASSLERALLENMQQSRKEGEESKTLSKKDIVSILENIGRANGDEQLNILRFKAGTVADELGMKKEYNKLNKILTRILTKKPSQVLKSPMAAAKIFGEPYEPTFISSLESFFRELSLILVSDLPEKNLSIQSFRNFAFFESYLSAQLENEWLHLDSAKEIINNQQPVVDPDYIEFKGLYDIASDWKEMKHVPETPEEFIESLRYRHSLIYRGMPDKKPGLFRDSSDNRWMDYLKVTGSLKKAFSYYKGLRSPFTRAVCLHFILLETKPFHHGNGIMARLVMNTELVASNQSKILISPMLQKEYISSIEQNDISTFLELWKFSARIFGNDMQQMQRDMGM